MDYFDWVNLYPNYIIIEKTENSYKGTGNAAYVLNDLLNYPLSTGEYGHVVAEGNNLGEIIDALSLNKINYIVVDDGNILCKKLYDDSEYSPYVITNYIKNSVSRNIERSRTGEKEKKKENPDKDRLTECLNKLCGSFVYHKNESYGKGTISKAYLSQNGEIYIDVKFEGLNEQKSFMFIYCTENGIIKISDSDLLKEISELYKKLKK